MGRGGEGRGGEGRGGEGGGEGRGGEGRGERDIKLQVKMNRVIRLLYSLERGERGGRYKNYFIPVSCDTSSLWLQRTCSRKPYLVSKGSRYTNLCSPRGGDRKMPVLQK